MPQPVKMHPKCFPVTAGHKLPFYKAGSLRVKFLFRMICQMEAPMFLDEPVTPAEILYLPFPPICLHFTNGHIILSNCGATWKLGTEFRIIIRVKPVTLCDYI